MQNSLDGKVVIITGASSGIGAAVARLLAQYGCKLTLAARSVDKMQAIADATPGSVSLCVPDKFEMLILKRAMGSGALVFNHRVGARLPMVRSGAGLAYLAAIDEERLELVSAQLKEITADDWDKTQAMIAGARKMYRDYGFVLAEQIFHPDIRAVATPAEAKSGGRVFTLSCAGPIASREKLMKDIGPRLVALAKNIRSTSLMLT